MGMGLGMGLGLGLGLGLGEGRALTFENVQNKGFGSRFSFWGNPEIN